MDELLAKVKTLLSISQDDVAQDDLLTLYLQQGQSEILSWGYTGLGLTVIPTEKETTLIMAVVGAFNQQGAEGAKSVGSASVSHSFAYDDMVSYIRSHVPNRAKVF